MSKCFNICSHKKENNRDVINLSSRICQKCKINNSKYLRKINIDNVPQEYILPIDDIRSCIIINTYKKNPRDKIHFINFPHDFVLTKYDYYLCQSCYDDKSHDHIWNYWIEL
jgi:hypothetical protein